MFNLFNLCPEKCPVCGGPVHIVMWPMNQKIILLHDNKFPMIDCRKCCQWFYIDGSLNSIYYHYSVTDQIRNYCSKC